MKTLIYLDQSYASSLAAARRGDSRGKSAWLELDAALRDAVNVRETVLCPKTRFQFEESSLDSRRAAEIMRVVEDYSAGVSFLYWSQLLDSQTSVALDRFLGQTGQEVDWGEIFDENPHDALEGRTIEAFGGRARVIVTEQRPAEFIEEHRASKLRYVNELEAIREQRPTGSRVSFRDALASQKMSFVKAHFIDPMLHLIEARRRREFPSLLALHNAEPFLWLEKDARLQERTERGVQEFLLSPELAATPFIDVYCSLYAAIDTFLSGRQTQKGDFDDITTLASVVPYCHIVTMDSSMRDLCQKAGLDRSYGVAVYSPSAADVSDLAASIAAI